MFNLNLKDSSPIYEQLYNQIVKMASINILNDGEQIPSVRTLAKRLRINPNTVQKAYKLLEQDNIIYTVKGKGSFILSNKNASNKEKEILKLEINEVLAKAYDANISKQQIIKVVDEFYENKVRSLTKGSDILD